MQMAKAVIFLLVNSCQILRKLISKSPDLHDEFQESSTTSFPISNPYWSFLFWSKEMLDFYCCRSNTET
jgi:hypothetical protein